MISRIWTWSNVNNGTTMLYRPARPGAAVETRSHASRLRARKERVRTCVVWVQLARVRCVLGVDAWIAMTKGRRQMLGSRDPACWADPPVRRRRAGIPPRAPLTSVVVPSRMIAVKFISTCTQPQWVRSTRSILVNSLPTFQHHLYGTEAEHILRGQLSGIGIDEQLPTLVLRKPPRHYLPVASTGMSSWGHP